MLARHPPTEGRHIDGLPHGGGRVAGEAGAARRPPHGCSLRASENGRYGTSIVRRKDGQTGHPVIFKQQT